jgi:SAM-dependent methyltransferase
MFELQTRFPRIEIMGLEVSESGVAIARRKVPTATVLQRDLVDSTKPDAEHRAWATHAICSEVIEHVDQPERLLSNAMQYLAPGCLLVVTVPGGPMSAFDHHIGHRRHYSSDDLTQLLAAVGLRVESIARAGFPFFNVYRLAIVLRGKRLVRDVTADNSGSSSRTARFLMGVFRQLFALNLDASPFGWQMVARATVPDNARLRR